MSSFDRDETLIKKHNQTDGTYSCIVRSRPNLVDCYNFTYKATNIRILVEWKCIQDENCDFGRYVATAELFCLKSVEGPGYRGWSVHVGKFSSR